MQHEHVNNEPWGSKEAKIHNQFPLSFSQDKIDIPMCEENENNDKDNHRTLDNCVSFESNLTKSSFGGNISIKEVNLENSNMEYSGEKVNSIGENKEEQ